MHPSELAGSVSDEHVGVAPGVSLHLRRWAGPPGAREFLLVHGLSSNARLWDGVAARLAAAGHPATAVDLRSHGTSDAPETGYDTGTAARDLAAVAAGLDIRGAVVAGQSWGGNVVITLAARHPQVAAALALVDGGWFSPSEQFPSWEACERALRPPDIDGSPASQVRDFMRRAHPDWSDVAIEATVANLAVAADGTVRRRLSIAHHMAIVRSMWDDPPQRHYPAVRMPVLLMPALPNDATAAAPRRARVAAAAAALPDATVSEYPGGDHDLHAQQPDRVAAELLALAARLDPAAAPPPATPPPATPPPAVSPPAAPSPVAVPPAVAPPAGGRS
jgi:pimeloyl-ACP methyl ester carboxylesterase